MNNATTNRSERPTPLTKTHFEAIAAIVKGERGSILSEHRFAANAVLDSTSERFADYFATQNPQFSRSRFLAACGVEVGK